MPVTMPEWLEGMRPFTARVSAFATGGWRGMRA